MHGSAFLFHYTERATTNGSMQPFFIFQERLSTAIYSGGLCDFLQAFKSKTLFSSICDVLRAFKTLLFYSFSDVLRAFKTLLFSPISDVLRARLLVRDLLLRDEHSGGRDLPRQPALDHGGWFHGPEQRGQVCSKCLTFFCHVKCFSR